MIHIQIVPTLFIVQLCWLSLAVILLPLDFPLVTTAQLSPVFLSISTCTFLSADKPLPPTLLQGQQVL